MKAMQAEEKDPKLTKVSLAQKFNLPEWMLTTILKNKASIQKNEQRTYYRSGETIKNSEWKIWDFRNYFNAMAQI